MRLTILGRQVKTLDQQPLGYSRFPLEGLEISRAIQEQLQACSELLILYKLYTHFSDDFSDLHKFSDFCCFSDVDVLLALLDALCGSACNSILFTLSVRDVASG
jgi:hypothetical protein